MCLVEVIVEFKAKKKKKKKIFECLLGHCCFHKYGTPPEGPGRLALGHVAPQRWRGFSSQGWVTWGWLDSEEPRHLFPVGSDAFEEASAPS